MGEPESLATDEGIDPHVARHALDRLVMLSDGIFAIATTLAAIEVRLPEHTPGGPPMLTALLGPAAGYVLSFAVIAVFWLGSRDLFARVRRVDLPLTVLTLALLCLVALIPSVVGAFGHGHESSELLQLYAGTMGVCGLANLAVWLYAILRPGILRAEVPTSFKVERGFGAAAVPLVFGPLFVLGVERVVDVALPVALALVLARRGLLPRFAARFDQPSELPAVEPTDGG